MTLNLIGNIFSSIPEIAAGSRIGKTVLWLAKIKRASWKASNEAEQRDTPTFRKDQFLRKSVAEIPTAVWPDG